MTALELLLVAVLLWFGYRLARAPRDVPLRAVVACLVCALFGSPYTVRVIREWSGGGLGPAAGKLVENVALNGAWLSLVLFFLFSASGARRRALAEAAVAVAVSAVMAGAVLAAPAGETVFPGTGALPERIGSAPLAVFYLAGSAYFAYAAFQALRWSLRYAAECTRHARQALRVAAVGFGCFALASAVRAVFVAVRAGGGTVAPPVAGGVDALVPVGAVLFLGGIAYGGLLVRAASLRVWLRHRRRYRQLRLPWELLHEAFPQDCLHRGPGGRVLDRLSPRRVHRRYWRRVVEIRDGLVRLGPQLADLGFHRDAPIPRQAALVREALRLRHAGAQPRTRAAVLVAAPRGDDREADVEQLVRLARALAETGPAGPRRP